MSRKGREECTKKIKTVNSFNHNFTPFSIRANRIVMKDEGSTPGLSLGIMM
ncbi:MAG: hypothetical protein K9N46_09910 [Candidatus Marinimicrobia bacterium]|nr:hypothetical protein [Candidatus Neomarinimicrobiota bacterium]